MFIVLANDAAVAAEAEIAKLAQLAEPFHRRASHALSQTNGQTWCSACAPTHSLATHIPRERD